MFCIRGINNEKTLTSLGGNNYRQTYKGTNYISGVVCLYKRGILYLNCIYNGLAMVKNCNKKGATQKVVCSSIEIKTFERKKLSVTKNLNEARSFIHCGLHNERQWDYI